MKQLFSILLLTCLCSLTGKAFAQTAHPDFVDGQMHFKFVDSYEIYFTVQKDKDSTIFPSELPFLKEMSSRYGIKKIHRPYVLFNDARLLRTINVQFDSIYKVDLFIKELYGYEFIEYAEKDPLYASMSVPNDPFYGTINGQNRRWYLDVINAEKAWEIQTGKSDIVVAIVDNAVWGEHEDLQIPTSLQYNAISSVPNSAPPTMVQDTCQRTDSCPAFSFSHGTHVAGLVGAISNNGIGIASIGGGVTLMGVRAANDRRELTATVAGVKWAAEHGAKVINMSFGGYSYNGQMNDLLRTCYNNGIVLVAAAGNDNTASKMYPAAYTPYVISVASSDYNKNLSSFSNYGSWVDIAGPGGVYSSSQKNSYLLSCTYSTNISLQNQGFDGQYYDVMQGTSMACPVVAGLVGLMLSKNPALHTDTIRSILQRTSQALSGSKTINSKGGLIDAYAALLTVPMLTPNFISTTPTGNQPLSVTYKNTSTAPISPIDSILWKFEGGIPSTSSADTVTVVYNNPGLFKTSIWIKDTLGFERLLEKPYYVNIYYPGTPECITKTNIRTGDTLSLYALANCGGAGEPWGWISGHNEKKDSVFAEYFANTETLNISSVFLTVGEVVPHHPDSSIIVRVYSSSGDKKPDNVLAETEVTYEQLLSDQNVNVELDETITVTGDFFVGYQISYSNVIDTLAIYTSTGMGSPTRVDSNATAMVLRNGDWVKLKDECANLPISFAVGANACREATGSPYLAVESESLLLDSIQYTALTSIISNREWDVKRSGDSREDDSVYLWISVTPSKYTGNGILSISVAENPYHETRSVSYSVALENNDSKTINITQKAAPLILDLNTDNIGITAGIKSSSFSVISTVEWDISLSDSTATWITLSQTTGKGNQTIKIRTEEYTEVDRSRSIDIIVKAKKYSNNAILHFTQVGDPLFFALYPSLLNFSADTLVPKSLVVETNSSWNITHIADWLTPSSTSGLYSANLTMVPNSENNQQGRIDTVLFKSENEYRGLVVNQAGKTGIIPVENPQREIFIHPNPTNSVLFVENAKLSIENIRLLDISGKLLKEVSKSNLSTQTIRIDMSGFPTALYFLHIKTDDGKFHLLKALKQ